MFSVDNGERQLFLRQNQLVRYGSWQYPSSTQAIWLSDGSWLAGEISYESNAVVVTSDWFEPVRVPLNGIRGIVNNPPASIDSWVQRLRWFDGRTGGNDHVVLLDGKQLEGLLSWDTEKNQIAIQAAGRELAFNLDEFDALAFSPALFARSPTTGAHLLGLEDGTLLRLASEKVDWSEDQLSFQTQSGILLKTLDKPSDFAAEATTYIVQQPKGSMRLDEQEIVSYRHLSSNRLKWQLGVKADALGRPLIKQSSIVHHGVAMHSESLVSYRWGGDAGVFCAELRFAPVQNGGLRDLGNVVCQILVVRDGKLQTSFERELSRKESKGVAVQADVSGAQLIVLTTKQGKSQHFGDHILWLDPRVDAVTK